MRRFKLRFQMWETCGFIMHGLQRESVYTCTMISGIVTAAGAGLLMPGPVSSTEPKPFQLVPIQIRMP